MTMEDCYCRLGGNYGEVITRLPSPGMVEKFTVRFLDDQSFDMLCKEIEAGNRKEAFRAAHTLKGVCANLSFTRLMESSGRLTEALRPETDAISDEAAALMENVRQDYQSTVTAIQEYLAEK